MTDAKLLELLDILPTRPALVVGDRKFVHFPGVILASRRVGKGERWSFAPGRDIVPINVLPIWFPREAREWAFRAERLNFAAHARAMAARTL